LRTALEAKIQSEINELNEVVQLQGQRATGENQFDYELVKVVKDEFEEQKDKEQKE